MSVVFLVVFQVMLRLWSGTHVNTHSLFLPVDRLEYG